jgi:hypothetical protein
MSDSMVTDPGTDILDGPGTALTHACTRVPTAAPADLVSATLDGMRGKHFDSAVAVAVLDGDSLAGVAMIERMLEAPGAPHCVTSWIRNPRSWHLTPTRSMPPGRRCIAMNPALRWSMTTVGFAA